MGMLEDSEARTGVSTTGLAARFVTGKDEVKETDEYPPKKSHLATVTENDPRWAAVVARDPEAKFYYSVKTTGV
jgi:hypothetical protein